MSNFTPLVEYKTTFDGDDITIQLSRLKRKHFLTIAPYITKDVDEEGNLEMSFEDQAQFAEVMAQIIPECVKSFNGLVMKTGEPLDINVVVVEGYFQNLMGSIMAELLQISKPTEEEGKKLPPEQPESSSPGNSEIIPSSAVT